MGIISRAIVHGQLKVGVLKAHQITKIENGGIFISSANSKYQPDYGMRHELTPDEWYLYTYAFFPRDYPKETYDKDFLNNQIYYDYFSKESPMSPNGRWYSRKNIYGIFKNKIDTGYRIIETSFSSPHSGSQNGTYYAGLHINQFGMSRYIEKVDYYPAKFRDASCIEDAVICMMADLEAFQREMINLSELLSDCEEYPGSCALGNILKNQIEKCQRITKYIIK